MQETPQLLAIPLNLIFELIPDRALPDDFSRSLQMTSFDSIDRIVKSFVAGRSGCLSF